MAAVSRAGRVHRPAGPLAAPPRSLSAPAETVSVRFSFRLLLHSTKRASDVTETLRSDCEGEKPRFLLQSCGGLEPVEWAGGF